jgi:TonB family protein
MSPLQSTTAKSRVTIAVQARWCVLSIFLLACACAASIPPQHFVANLKTGAVSDDDWAPPFEEHARCSAVLPPKPLATPVPAFPKASGGSLKIRFVIGTDGRLHKVAVVNSGGHNADAKAVNALRRWRYEPATCNGIPMEAEGTVEFPLR